MQQRDGNGDALAHAAGELVRIGWLGGQPLVPRTGRSITDRDLLWGEIVRSGERGFGVDDQESEVGVNCVALAVPLSGGRRGAISISGLTYRRSLESLVPAPNPSICEDLQGFVRWLQISHPACQPR